MPPATDEAAPDVTVRFGETPAWASNDLIGARERYRTPRGDDPLDNLVVYDVAEGFIFRYADGTDFYLTPDGREIWSRWPEPATLADTETYFLGPILGFSLRLRGILCLHASAVVIDGAAVALCGGSMAGKSTTAGAFAAAGFAVLSDDLVAVRETPAGPTVAPAYPYLKLWNEAAAILLGASHALPTLTPTWEKRALELGARGYAFACEPLALSAIVTLAPRAADADRPRVAPSSATTALMELVPETYAGYLLDGAMRRQEFLQLGELLRRVPTYRAEPSDDASRLPALVARIAAAVRR